MESKASINSVIFTILKYQVKWTQNTNNIISRLSIPFSSSTPLTSWQPEVLISGLVRLLYRQWAVMVTSSLHSRIIKQEREREREENNTFKTSRLSHPSNIPTEVRSELVCIIVSRQCEVKRTNYNSLVSNFWWHIIVSCPMCF